MFQHHKAHIQLEVACIGDLNTEAKFCGSNDSNNNNCNEEFAWVNFPRFYGSAISLGTGRVFPAIFVSKDPANLLRYSRLYSSPRIGLHRLWDHKLESIVIHPFSYELTRSKLEL